MTGRSMSGSCDCLARLPVLTDPDPALPEPVLPQPTLPVPPPPEPLPPGDPPLGDPPLAWRPLPDPTPGLAPA